jgi:methylthioribose-1-phosphate isomerase
VGAVVVGADRIAANGDTANKIGTYRNGRTGARKQHSFLCRCAGFYSWISSIASGEEIPIEERSAEEVTHIAGVPHGIAADVRAAHPAFDVTPARLIAAIITERGVARAPYQDSLRKIKSES